MDVFTTDQPGGRQRKRFHIPLSVGTCVLLAVAVFFLWQEHRAHMLGVLPWALLLLCPLIHIFMHRGHSGHERVNRGEPGRDRNAGSRGTS